MLQGLLTLDRDLLLTFNHWHSPFWDEVMWYATKTVPWIPVYLLIIFLIFRQYGIKRTLLALFFIAVLVVLCDQVSVLLKNLIERPRPTHDPVIAPFVQLVHDYRGGQFGCPSSHAANYFGLITFLMPLLRSNLSSLLLIVWAVFVSYTRIYLGVHYPFDIFFGAALGILIGFSIFMAYASVNLYFLKRNKLI